jgi:hypothetical protein
MSTAAKGTAHRTHVSYIDKSREFYAAHGYGAPYRWAHNVETPFAVLAKPLAESRVGIVTTSFPHFDDQSDGRAGGNVKIPYALAVSDLPDRMFTDDLSWDKDATHTDDLGSFLPIAQLQAAAAAGRIRSVSPRIYGVPTDYSQRRTRDVDAPALLDLIREDDVDAMILVPL